jgi:Na+-translocating ferredoxin:NAD+ oxidoreductase RnfD subunit
LTREIRAEVPRPSLASLALYPQKNPKLRLMALWYFCTLMTVWNILGRTVLGFEQSFLQYFVAVGTAIAMQIFLEWVDARANDRTPRYRGGLANFLNFLPPAIIAGSACSMLIFPNDRLWPFAFAAALSIGSKVLFRAPLGNGATQHVFNPSNLGVTVTLILLPWVGVAPPYHFANRVEGAANLVIPVFILATGIFLHWMFTQRLPLIVAFLSAFVLQGLARSWLFGMPWPVPLMPMLGAAFVVFTLYMIPDPATSPIGWKEQVAFGAAIPLVYAFLISNHQVYGVFVSLVIVTALRGAWMHLRAWRGTQGRLAPQAASSAA